MTTTNSLQTNNRCMSAIPYSGNICREELLSLIECSSENSTDLLVLADTSVQAQQFIRGLKAFGSPGCVAAAVPLLCLSLFGGVCDENGAHYLPTRRECLDISTGVCQMEWELAQMNGLQLPVDCTLLPERSSEMCSNREKNLNTTTGESCMVVSDSRGGLNQPFLPYEHPNSHVFRPSYILL